MVEALVRMLREGRRIVFFGGAGVSTESGIPDFRSEDGLFRAKRDYGHSPEELLSHDCFLARPDLFYRYYRANLLYPDAGPNGAHLALAELEAMGRLVSVITQNIDGLHQAAGSREVRELHGSIHRNSCMNCGAPYGPEVLGEEGIPRCGDCGGMVRPDVVLYGEQLDEAVLARAVADLGSADTLLVGGTSLAVYPAAGLLRYFRGERVALLNRDPTPQDAMASLIIREPIGRVLAQAMERFTKKS